MGEAGSLPVGDPGERANADPAEARGWSRRWNRLLAVPVLALGIAFVSVMSGLVTWRAAEWSNRADRFERLAMQDVAFRHQIRAEIGATVDENLRTFGAYEEHYNHAVGLEADEARVYDDDPHLARRLTREAQQERSSANGVLRYLSDYPGYESDSNLATFDAAAALRQREADDPDLATLRQSENAELAREAQDKARNLVGVALIFAASLFFLTMAQLSARAVSRGFAVAGTLVALVAWGLFIAF
jgi:lipopolysaccharide export LptBFGC system permease protein LptF